MVMPHIQTLNSQLNPNLNMYKALFCHVFKTFPRLLILNFFPKISKGLKDFYVILVFRKETKPLV